jgi:hypothetical protein
MDLSVDLKPIALEDWAEVDDLPWSDSYVYQLLRRYPDEIATVLLGATAGGQGGKRLISRSSLEALIAKLSAQQAADKETKARRSKIYRDKRFSKQREEALT